MSEEGITQPAERTNAVIITLELVDDEEKGNPALINAIGFETVDALEKDGYTLRPVYTGLRGGPFLVEILQTVGQTTAQVWANRTAIEEGLNDFSALVTIFGAVHSIITHLHHAQAQQIGTDESLAHPVKIVIEIDGTSLVLETPGMAQAATALNLAQHFITSHPQEAAQVNPKSQVKVMGRIPRKPHRRHK